MSKKTTSEIILLDYKQPRKVSISKGKLPSSIILKDFICLCLSVKRYRVLNFVANFLKIIFLMIEQYGTQVTILRNKFKFFHN